MEKEKKMVMLDYAKKCWVEYKYECENCYHCNLKTISKEERLKELKEKVEEFKKSKTNKIIRKAQFGNWIKTEALFKNKAFSNYKKWEMYESSEDEGNKEPILPKSDPNFIALEKRAQ